jgi:hypothetical protein
MVRGDNKYNLKNETSHCRLEDCKIINCFKKKIKEVTSNLQTARTKKGNKNPVHSALHINHSYKK